MFGVNAKLQTPNTALLLPSGGVWKYALGLDAFRSCPGYPDAIGRCRHTGEPGLSGILHGIDGLSSALRFPVSSNRLGPNRYSVPAPPAYARRSRVPVIDLPLSVPWSEFGLPRL